MSNFLNLNAAIAELLTQVESTKGVQQSAVALISGFADLVVTKVTEALTADANADDASITAAVEAINNAKNEMVASTTALGDAVQANSAPPPPPPPPSV